MTPFVATSIVAAAALVLAAATLRSKSYAAFVGVLLTIQVLVTAALESRFDPVAPALWYGQAVVFLHFATLIRARLRPSLWRALVSVPAHFFMAGTMLAFPWAIADAVGLTPHGFWLPWLAAAVGLAQSMYSRREIVDIRLDGADVGALRRHAAGVSRQRVFGRMPADRDPAAAAALHVVQITDPHLGPFMSEARLRRICTRAVEAEPDLVLLTGDFLTMEGAGSGEALARALAPLQALPGRVFACRGNHDLEHPELVAAALSSVGIRLLNDAAEVVETPHGPVQVVGIDHVWRNRQAHYLAVCDAHPPLDGVPRLVLLHDPGGFDRLPPGGADLVLSGHTHGGHVGLLIFGLPHTAIGLLSRIPDHGLWGKGPSRLYVHRANGHYGFPLRIGVPAEESVLRLHLP